MKRIISVIIALCMFTPIVFASSVNDPLYSSQYGLTKIDASHAWDVQPNAGQGVRIAILDSGIGYNVDLDTQIDFTQDFTGSSIQWHDSDGHGTQVAGIASAIANNSVHIAGVAFKSRLLIGKVLYDGTGTLVPATIASGIQWATNYGAKVINLSIEAYAEGGGCPTEVQNAIDFAWNSNVVIVAAAGNAHINGVSWPAVCNHVLVVGATDSADAIWIGGTDLGSNYGSKVQLAAPGKDIVTTWNQDDTISVTGTGFAAAFVSGAAAMVWASSFGTSNSAVVNRLTSTADAISGTSTLWVNGRLNVAKAVGYVSQPPVTLTPVPTPIRYGSCKPRPNIVITRNVNTINITAPTTITSVVINGTTNATTTTPTINGTNASFTITPGSGAYMVRFTITDGCGPWPTFVGKGS